MSERLLWDYLRKGMGPLWEAQRHEDSLSIGIPDVSYAITHHGWIELKYRAEPPKRPNSPLTIKHFTADQRNWLTRFGKKAGRCWILLQVDKTYMLFSWGKVQRVGAVSYAEHLKMAERVWVGGIDWEEFTDFID